MSVSNSDSAQLILIAEKWFAAFNIQSIEDLLSLYSDNAEHFSPRLQKNHPETNGLIKGKAAMREWWQSSFDKMPSLKYYCINLKVENELVFMQYNRRVDGEVDVRVNEMLQIKDNKIIFSKVIPAE